MFERYTEKARRVIFFARYEASQLGSNFIETEHLLLGLFREEQGLVRILPQLKQDEIRNQIEKQTFKGTKISTMIDLPLSHECKRVLEYAAGEADQLEHHHIGTDHLLLGLLRESGCLAEVLLKQYGVDLHNLREHITKTPTQVEAWTGHAATFKPEPREYKSAVIARTVEIHGGKHDAEYIRERVRACREFSWHWNTQNWMPRDLIIHRKTGAISFEADLIKQPDDFQLIKAGWKKDHCYICRWELFESVTEPAHGIAHTNGRDWVCTECFEKFLKGPDFFSSTSEYSYIT